MSRKIGWIIFAVLGIGVLWWLWKNGYLSAAISTVTTDTGLGTSTGGITGVGAAVIPDATQTPVVSGDGAPAPVYPPGRLGWLAGLLGGASPGSGPPGFSPTAPPPAAPPSAAPPSVAPVPAASPAFASAPLFLQRLFPVSSGASSVGAGPSVAPPPAKLPTPPVAPPPTPSAFRGGPTPIT